MQYLYIHTQTPYEFLCIKRRLALKRVYEPEEHSHPISCRCRPIIACIWQSMTLPALQNPQIDLPEHTGTAIQLRLVELVYHVHNAGIRGFTSISTTIFPAEILGRRCLPRRFVQGSPAFIHLFFINQIASPIDAVFDGLLYDVTFAMVPNTLLS